MRLTEFLQKMFVQTGYNITEEEEVIVYAPEYLKNASVIVENTPKR